MQGSSFMMERETRNSILDFEHVTLTSALGNG